MNARIFPLTLAALIGASLAAGIPTAATAAGTAPPGASGPVFGQPATAPAGTTMPGMTAPGGPSGSAYGDARWDMDGTSERRDKRRRGASDGRGESRTAPGDGDGERQPSAPAFP